MKRVFMALVAFLLIAEGCKKTLYQSCETCPRFSVDSFKVNYCYTPIDSSAFYRSLLGKWVVKQQDLYLSNQCVVKCFSDTQFYAVFLANDSVRLNFPGGLRDTFAYMFHSDGDSTVDPQSGYYIALGASGGLCVIGYAGKYLTLSPPVPAQTPRTLDLAPEYYLARH